MCKPCQSIFVTEVKGVDIAEKKVEKEAGEMEDAKRNGFENTDQKKSVKINIGDGKHEIKGVKKMEIDVKMTIAISDEPSEKTFRDVGTDVPEEFLLNEIDVTTKKCVFKSSFLCIDL